MQGLMGSNYSNFANWLAGVTDVYVAQNQLYGTLLGNNLRSTRSTTPGDPLYYQNIFTPEFKQFLLEAFDRQYGKSGKGPKFTQGKAGFNSMLSRMVSTAEEMRAGTY